MGIDWIFCSLGEKIAVPKGCPKHWCSLEARGARGWDQRYRLPPGVMVAPGKGRISDRGTICMTCKQELLWSFPATHRAACHLASLPLAHGWGWREGEGNRKVRPGLRKGCDPGEEALLPLSSSCYSQGFTGTASAKAAPPPPQVCMTSEGVACVALTFSTSEDTLGTLLEGEATEALSAPVQSASSSKAVICSPLCSNLQFSKCGPGTPGVPQETSRRSSRSKLFSE